MFARSQPAPQAGPISHPILTQTFKAHRDYTGNIGYSANGHKLQDPDGLSTSLPSSRRLRFNELQLVYASILLVAIGLLISARSHFWLDETNTYVATNGGFSQIYTRCVAYPISILYITLMVALRGLGAVHEWAFRVPSLAAFALSTLWLFRLSRRMFDARVAWFTIAIFAQMGAVAFAAVDARPYALGLLFVIISTDLLHRIMEAPSYSSVIWYGITAALVLHFHLIMGVVLIVHVLYFAYDNLGKDRRLGSYVWIAMLAFAVIAAPLLIQIMAMAGNAKEHVMPGRPEFGDLAFALFPKRQTAALLGAVCVALAVKRKLQWKVPAGIKSNVALAITWMLLPPVVLFLIASVSPMLLFYPRYFLPYAPGLALCFGLVMASLQPRLAGQAGLIILMITAAVPFLVPAQLQHTYNRGDWASALAFVEKATASDHAPVFIRSQYIESDVDSLDRPMDDNWDFSPLAYYRANARWLPLPLTLTERQTSALDGLFDGDLRTTPRILFISFSGPASYLPYLKYFQTKIGPAHGMRQIGAFDYVDVYEFLR